MIAAELFTDIVDNAPKQITIKRRKQWLTHTQNGKTTIQMTSSI